MVLIAWEAIFLQQLDLLVGDWTNLLSRRFPRLRD